MNDDQINPVAEEAEAIRRLAYTADGKLMHRYLRRVLETVYDTPHDSALRSHNGRRTLARDLMQLMAEGIDSAAGRSSDLPVLARPGGPIAVARTRGPARRVGPSPEPIAESDAGSDAA